MTRRRKLVVKYLDENLAAVDVRLTSEDLKQIDAALPPGIAAGDRYPAHALKAVNL